MKHDMRDEQVANTAQAIMEGKQDENLWMDIFSDCSGYAKKLRAFETELASLEALAGNILDAAADVRSAVPGERTIMDPHERQLFQNAEKVRQTMTDSMQRIERRMTRVRDMLARGWNDWSDVMLRVK